MSFRTRLTLFFVLIVVVPMAAAGIVLFLLIADNEQGKAKASLAANQNTAIALYNEAHDQADRAAVAIARDVPLSRALRANDRAAIRARARALLDRRDVMRIVIAHGRDVIADVGDGRAVFPATRTLVGEKNRRFGRLQVSVQDPDDYAGLTERVTKLQTIVLRRGGPVIAATINGVRPDALRLGSGYKVDVGGTRYTAATFPA